MATSNSNTPVSRVQAGDNKASATEAGALAGSNGTGNALSDDTTTTGVLSVSAIRTGAVSATGVAGTIGVALQGLYGSLTINQNGTYVYVVDNSNAAVNTLAKGKSLEESFTYTASNGSASAQAAIVVKVNGANDVATIAGQASGAVLEDGATAVASGKLTVTDVDLGESLVKTDNEQSGEYGKFSISSDGAWTYVLNNKSSDLQSLSAGETVTEKFVVASKDGSASQNVIVTVTGANDVARIEGDARGTLTEDAKKTVARGELSIKDADHGESAARAVTNQTGTYGAFSVDAKGGWTYVLNNSLAAVQALAQGAKGSDSFVVWSKDGSTSQTVTMTINGINDVATITGADAGSVNEDASPNTATGKLTVNDVDLGENTVVPVVNRIGSFGSFSIATDGTWTYTLNNSLASVQALGAGVVRTETFTVYSKDSQLPSLHEDDNDNEEDHDKDSGDDDHQTADYHGASKVLTVTIIGTNDAAVISGSSTGTVTEDLSVAASGQLSAADLDTGEIGFRAQSAIAGTYGSFSLDAAGNWAYGLNNAAANVQALAANETVTETFTVKSFDGTEKLVTVTVTGTNDVASISGTSTGSATEDTALTSSGTLTVSDVDHGQALVQAQANTAGVYGSFHIASDGSWTYALSNAAANVQALAAGEQVTDGFTVLSQDGSASQIVTVTLTGSNDAPVITNTPAALLGTVKEDTALSATGLLSASDVDHGATQTWSVQGSATGTYGAIAVDATGKWTYVLDNAAHETMAAGETHIETFTVRVTDDKSAFVDQEVSVTVNGTNDIAAIAGSSTGAVTEDTTLTASGNLTVSDVDTGEAFFRVQTAVAGTYGSFSIGASGNWTYALNNGAANVQALNTADHVSDNFTVLSKDGSASQSVSVALTGTNDAPVLQGTQTDQLYTSSLSVWTPFLVNNGVWVTPTGASSGDMVPHTFVRQFTAAQDGNYVFQFAVDNEGSVLVDGVAVPGLFNNDWSKSTVQTVALTAGIHTVTMNALNLGGPAAFAMNITDPNNHEIWNTRTHLDPEPLILSYTENQAAMAVSPGLTLTDIDSPTMTHATVAVATGFAAGQDVLGFANQNGISGAYDASTGVLNLSGSATQAQYQAALRSVAYSNSSDSPSTADRTINFTVDDGSVQSNLSNTVQGKIIVLAVNDAPRGAATAALAAGTEDTAYTVSAANLLAGFSDVDAGDTLSVSGLTASNGTLVNNGNGTFTITPTANFNGAVTLSYNVIDGHGGSVVATQSCTLTAVNDAAIITGTSAGAVTEDAAQNTVTGILAVSDVDTGEAAFVPVTNKAATYGSFGIDANGQWSYALDNSNTAVNALSNGQSLSDKFSVATLDGTTQTISVTINGHTDANAINVQQAVYQYVGSFIPSNGPSFSTNPAVYTAQEAAALVYGGNASQYAVSTNSSTITHTGYLNGWGEHTTNMIFVEDYKLDLGNAGYNTPRGSGTARSAWVADGNNGTNYAWRIILGTDVVRGTAGADEINGSPGGEVIHGLGGADIITGGAGADIFVFDAYSDSTSAQSDLIADFTKGTDQLSLNLLDGNPATPLAQNDLKWAGLNANPSAGFVGFSYDVANNWTVVKTGDPDGAGPIVGLEIHLVGNVALAASDFVYLA